jgi:hypothetical protein
MKERTRRRLRRWDLNQVYWQDIVAMVAGAWLVLTVALNISPDPVISGWLAFIGGVLTLYVGAAAFQDANPALSWTVAVGGLIAVIGAVISAAYAEMLAFWTIMAGGAVILFVEVWSAALKRRESRREARRVERGEPVRA